MCQLSNFKYTMEELELIVASLKQEMDAAIKHLDHAFQKIRAGRASTSMVQDVMVEYYGAMTPINQVANVSVPDAMTISIQPWDRSAIGPIEKAIINSHIEFAKLHVEAALKEAEIAGQNNWGNSKKMKDAILNSYLLENIK